MAFFFGTSINDIINGTSDSDFILGRAGDDVIYGFGGLVGMILFSAEAEMTSSVAMKALT